MSFVEDIIITVVNVNLHNTIKQREIPVGIEICIAEQGAGHLTRTVYILVKAQGAEGSASIF